MSALHAHRHLHPHPRGKAHHHPFLKRSARGRPPGNTAHEHRVWRGWLPPPTEAASPRIKRLWRAVHSWWPRIGSLGIYARRKIAGSIRWSEHSWGDAWDVTDAETVKENRYSDQLKDVLRWLGGAAVTARLKITRIIQGDASHKNHAHVDVDPDHEGTPP